MSELLTETVTGEFDEQGKPINVEPGSALLRIEDEPRECLVAAADPGVDIEPRPCRTCGAYGGVSGGIYYAADAPENGQPALFCGRYGTRRPNQPTPIELAPRVASQPERGGDYLRQLAALAGLSAKAIEQN